MLPFLKNKQEASGSSSEPIERKPDEEKEESFDGLETAMEELHSAFNSKDYSKAAEIFRSAQQLLDSEPHEEGPHV